MNTGDLVSLTPDGELNYIGRSKNVFKAPSTEWLFPELLENWLKEQAFVKDVLVKGVPVHGGYGCEVWVDTHGPYSLLEMETQIVECFGSEYKPANWYECEITRTELGKIDQVRKK